MTRIPAVDADVRPKHVSAAAIIVTTEEQLAKIVREQVEVALAEHAPKPGPVVLDRRGLAAALGVGVDTVDRLRREGCPEVLVGDSPRFELEPVMAFLRGRS